MRFTFVLVEPLVPENIGAAARAIKTMGFESLHLVNPCEYLEGKAQWVAHGSSEILDKARLFNNLKDALTGMDFIIASSTRHRAIMQDIIEITKLNSILNSKKDSTDNIAFVFGREDSGLTNSEIRLCDIVMTIPMKHNFPSLNLSQAVMVFAYELSRIQWKSEVTETIKVSDGSYRSIKNKVQYVLDNTKISANPVLAGRVIERLAHAGESDIKLIHSVSKAIIDKLQNIEKKGEK